MNAIQVKNVTKRFDQVTALDNITLTFEHGKIYGLLGRNGAGKSTLLNIITNRLVVNEGEVLIDGENAHENDGALHKCFLMSEVSLYPKNFKVKDVFYYTKQFYGSFDMEYADKLCKLFNLNAKKKVTQLSTGYTSIYKLITALSIDVPYVFFDEPVLGLDANHRDLFYKLMLERYVELQNTYVISTHLIEEISGMIEDIVILKDGRIECQAQREELLKQGFAVTGKATIVDTFSQGKQVIGSEQLGGYKTAYILGECDQNKIPSELEISKLDLQKLFIQLTNEQREGNIL